MNIGDAIREAGSEYLFSEEMKRGIVDELNKKYGPGSLDPSTGTFTPIEQPPQQDEK